MPQPTAYEPSTNFEQDTANSAAGRSTIRPDALDDELAALALTAAEILNNIALNQRDDGEIRDGRVKPHTLATSVLALIGSATGSRWNPRGAWVTATAYAVFDFVEEDGGSYLCLVAHTSGVFADDHTAGKWMLTGGGSGGGGGAASGVTFTPVGTIAAVDVQAAIAEAASEAVQKSANAADFASASSVRTNLSVPSKAEMQSFTPGRASAGGTSDAITASFTPAISALTNGLFVLVESGAANSTTTPTFQANATAAKTIVQGSNTPLYAGAIPGANYPMLLYYDSSLDKWVLANPYPAASTYNPAAVAITGGSITGLSPPLPVASGGTGAANATNAQTNLDVPSRSGTGATGTWAINISGTASGSAASQAQMEAAASNAVFVTPLSANWHPGVAKAWCKGTFAGAITVSHNMTSVTDVGTGQIAFNVATDFSSADYVPVVQALNSLGALVTQIISQAAGAVGAECGSTDYTSSSPSPQDPEAWFFAAYGDQA